MSVAVSEHDSAVMSVGLSVDEKVEKSGRPMVELKELQKAASKADSKGSCSVELSVVLLVYGWVVMMGDWLVDQTAAKSGRLMAEPRESPKVVE